MSNWTYDIDNGMSFRDCPVTILFLDGKKFGSFIGGDRQHASKLCNDLERGDACPVCYRKFGEDSGGCKGSDCWWCEGGKDPL